MELRQHIGILILLTISMFSLWLFDRVRKEEFKWFVPIQTAVFIWCTFEVLYWTIAVLII